MQKTRLLLAALATTVFAASSIHAIAHSRATGKPSVAASVQLTAKKKSKKSAAKKAKRKSKAVTVASFKSCGTYMYRKDGKCMDARAKK